MRALARVLLVSVPFIACTQKPPPEIPEIVVTVEPKQLLADGTAEVAVTAERPDSVDITLKTSKGTFKDTRTTTTTVSGGKGTVALVTCDARTLATCAGTVTINASSEDLATGRAQVTFLGYEVCGNGRDDDRDSKTDCEDEECANQECSLDADAGAVGRGRCDGTSKRCVCATGLVEVCNDGTDNNCDGKSDCADPQCPGKACRHPAGGGGTCTNGACSCPAGGEVCTDSTDNDCDALADCMDSDCQPSGADAGRICDESGHTCSPATGGTSRCTVCSGNGGRPEVTEGTTGGASLTCGDGFDNDCDSTVATSSIDCSDTDCVGRPCAVNGMVCHGPSKTCICSGNGGVAESAEATCNDGFDNDCDGRVDCADADCSQRVCGANGRKCTALNTCACGATTENCASPEDDDCDGLINCQQTLCRPGAVGLGQVCDQSGNTCSQVIGNTSTCTVCSGNGGQVETREGVTGGAAITCGDGRDNDCDGTPALPSTDCQDTDCAGRPCSTNGGICNATSKTCGCPGGLSNEEGLCRDNADNDCDGLLDCRDPDCQAHGSTPAGACGPGNGFVCTSGGTCACSGNGGVAQPTETTCNDRFDNDCDGLVDCRDPACLPVGNDLGQVCDSRGNTCSRLPADGGTSTCDVCSGNSGTAQVAEGSCFDTHDNDCDGRVDCEDSDCDGRSCSSTGRRCVFGGSLNCVCPGTEAGGEITCNDNLDNDCDGLVDCGDSDCASTLATCGANGLACTAARVCQCTGNNGPVEVSEGLTAGQATCGDGFDNDCDGDLDCLDTNCRPTASGQLGKDCSRPSASPPIVGTRCDITGACICPGGQSSESICGDVQDNDCDGLVDCADPNCLNSSCSTTGKVCGSTSLNGCVCRLTDGGIATSETNCANGLDDDCDGVADCADPDCANRNCNSISPNYQCSTPTPGTCRDITANNTLVLTVNRPSIPANGTATATVTATLSGSGTLSGQTITFSVISGAGSVTASAITNNSGVATATYTAGLSSGTATVQGSFVGSSVIFGTVTIEQPRLGQIRFTNQQYNVMGVYTSGFQEINQLTFQLLDSANAPYPAGLAVNFSHSAIGGSYIGGTPVCSGSPSVCTASGVTDGSGFVTVSLQSGSVAAVVSVQADATAGGSSQSASASNLAIVGARANGLHVSLDCTPRNIPAFANDDCTNSYVNTTIQCRAAFADRFNNVLGVQTLATFKSEAGAAGPPAQTPPYSAGSTTLGQANGYVNVGGYSLPVDVVPFANEYSETFSTVCGQKTHNPRDGLVTIIVSAVGEEGFVDGSNGHPADGQYNAGEYFVDQGEPYVDANDNGIRDANESYVDSNTSGTWDPPNGVWDGITTVWAETRVMYSGRTAQFATGGGPPDNHISRWYAFGATPPIPSPQPNFVVAALPPSTQTFGVYFADENFNYPASSIQYGLAAVAATPPVTVAWASPPLVIDSLGLAFTQRFCTLPSGGTCASVCNSGPCYVVSSVAGYSYGATGTAAITGTQPANPAQVKATAILLGVTDTLYISGVVQ